MPRDKSRQSGRRVVNIGQGTGQDKFRIVTSSPSSGNCNTPQDANFAPKEIDEVVDTFLQMKQFNAEREAALFFQPNILTPLFCPELYGGPKPFGTLNQPRPFYLAPKLRKRLRRKKKKQ